MYFYRIEFRNIDQDPKDPFYCPTDMCYASSLDKAFQFAKTFIEEEVGGRKREIVAPFEVWIWKEEIDNYEGLMEQVVKLDWYGVPIEEGGHG